jgi:hypothetical protein
MTRPVALSTRLTVTFALVLICSATARPRTCDDMTRTTASDERISASVRLSPDLGITFRFFPFFLFAIICDYQFRIFACAFQAIAVSVVEAGTPQTPPSLSPQLEAVPRQAGNLAGVGEHSNGALSDRDRLSGGVSFAAGFEKVLETGIRAE